MDSSMASLMEAPMQTLPLRIGAGHDLRAVLDALVAEHRVQAAFVLQGIGSLSVACIRFAGRPDCTTLRGDLEILTLGGSLSPDGPHLHVSVADAAGRVTGGHLGAGMHRAHDGGGAGGAAAAAPVCARDRSRDRVQGIVRAGLMLVGTGCPPYGFLL
jgi:predicted DNA-binding protein with PD1-like motif